MTTTRATRSSSAAAAGCGCRRSSCCARGSRRRRSPASRTARSSSPPPATRSRASRRRREIAEAAAPPGPVVVSAERAGEALRLDDGPRRASTSRSRGGRLHAVTGPSGSGKTTLLHLLAGLEVPDDGDDRRRRPRPDGARPHRAARRCAASTIAYVGQQAGLVPHLSALENVELALALRGREEGSAWPPSPRSTRWASASARRSASHASRTASARGSRSRARSPPGRRSCSPTSRPHGSTARTRSPSRSCSARLARATGAAVVCSTHDPLVIEQADSEISLS